MKKNKLNKVDGVVSFPEYTTYLQLTERKEKLKQIEKDIKLLEEELEQKKSQAELLYSYNARSEYAGNAISKHKYWSNEDCTSLVKIAKIHHSENVSYIEYNSMEMGDFASSANGILSRNPIPITKEQFNNTIKSWKKNYDER